MADATVTFSDGSSHVYEGVPQNVNSLSVFYRARKDFPNRRVAQVSGVPQAPLGDRLKAFFTTGQKDIATKDLPQLAMGIASPLQLAGLPIPPPKTPEDKANRRAGQELWAAIRPATPMLEAPAAVRGPLGRMVANEPRTLANAGKIAATAKNPPSTAMIPAASAAAKALLRSPGMVKAAAAAGFGYGIGAVPKFLHWLLAHAE